MPKSVVLFREVQALSRWNQTQLAELLAARRRGPDAVRVAASTSIDLFELVCDEQFDDTFKTNVYAMFWLCRAAVARMQRGSAIINTASIQAYDPSAELLATGGPGANESSKGTNTSSTTTS